jgi:nicotinate-nucleotide adenylyltransferase
MNPEAGFAVFGGTFDPVHFGHLESAAAVADLLGVSRIRLVPSFSPPHRAGPSSTPAQRLSMLQIATSGDDTMDVDDRELSRQGVSFTIDTLISFRAESGQAMPIYFILGIDSYCTLNEWERWRNLTDVAHLVVLDRPGYSREVPAEVLCWSQDRLVNDPGDLKQSASGAICLVHLVQVDVSATQIREMLRAGTRPAGKMPEEVIDYALEHGLYR